MAIFLFIFLILLLVYGVIIGFYHQAWQKIPLQFIEGGQDVMVSGLYPVSAQTDSQTPIPSVSIIVAIRNEAQHIDALVNNLLSQYFAPPHVEIILVNDHSTDDSLAIARKIVHPWVRVYDLPAELSGKKAAINTGIHHAGGDLIITTDADCHHQPLWLNSIVEFYRNTSAKFIAAPVKMVSGNTLLGIFQQLDFMILQGITGAAVHSKLHCMCNGANLAYEKSAFHEVNGFEGIDHIPSGDDMLLMYKIFRKYPDGVFYLKNRSAIVTTKAEASWNKFFHQRLRWASKSTHYHDPKIFLILLVTYLVNVAFVIMATIAIANPFYAWLLILLLLMKILFEYPLMNSVSSFFDEKKRAYLFPLFQPFHILYTVIAGWLGTFGSYQWKSRIVKNNGSVKLLKQ